MTLQDNAGAARRKKDATGSFRICITSSIHQCTACFRKDMTSGPLWNAYQEFLTKAREMGCTHREPSSQHIFFCKAYTRTRAKKKATCTLNRGSQFIMAQICCARETLAKSGNQSWATGILHVIPTILGSGMFKHMLVA